MSILIAMSGKMRSGKDAAGDYIAQRLASMGYSITRLAFADTLKRIADFAQKEAGLPRIKDRELLQYLGAEWGRKRNPNVWVDALERKIVDILEEDDCEVIIVTDLRFPNEFSMLRDRGFTLVRTSANASIRAMRGAEIDNMTHISETAVDDYDSKCAWDWFIENEDTLPEFHAKLDLVVAKAVLEEVSFL